MTIKLGTVLLFFITLTVVIFSQGRGHSTSATFPGDSWQFISPQQANVNMQRWDAWISRQAPKGSTKFGESHPGEEWGAVLVKDGKIIKTWGAPDYRYQSASVGKAFTKVVLQLAIDQGLITNEDALVMDYWTGEKELDNPHKYLNQGYHQNLTFRHLWQHEGGFPVTNGTNWITKKDIPEWSEWTGDPEFDNYAHVAPGTVYKYSSGGYWRLTQALTALWNKDLKSVLDEHIFNELDIEPEEWDWLPGEYVHGNPNFYKEMPNYGDFIDPPYAINGQVCVGGGGWVVMSPRNLARFGLLIANGGQWNGKRLISDTPLLAGHNGGNNSELTVKNNIVFAKVTTEGLEFPREVFENRLLRNVKNLVRRFQPVDF